MIDVTCSPSAALLCLDMAYFAPCQWLAPVNGQYSLVLGYTGPRVGGWVGGCSILACKARSET